MLEHNAWLAKSWNSVGTSLWLLSYILPTAVILELSIGESAAHSIAQMSCPFMRESFMHSTFREDDGHTLPWRAVPPTWREGT